MRILGVPTLAVAGVTAAVATFGAVDPAPAAAATLAGAMVVPAGGPAFAGDAPDPDILRAGPTYYAYTTGTTWGNHIGVLESSRPSWGFHTVTGRTWGSTALGPLPGWQRVDTQTSPGVFYWAGHYVMFYDAVQAASGLYCISVATSPVPQGPFLDDSSGPIMCQWLLGGSVDPQPFVDPSGRPWLYWKSNGGSVSSNQPAHLWVAALGGDGTSLASAPVDVMDQDTVNHPWETTIENPSMVYAGGGYRLFFAGGGWQTPGYAEGYADCAGPTGPCSQPTAGPILTSYGSAAGPAAGNAFPDAAGNLWLSYAAWTAGCTSYACGGARELYVAPLTLLPRALNAPIVGRADTPDGGGYWLVASDGGVFTYGDAGFYGSAGDIPLARPITGMASTPDGRGYWLVASDGGVFTYGDAGFYGSTGGIPLPEPIVGIQPSLDGHGYRLLTADGSAYKFGDA
jgi:hypothetical protein